MDPDRPGDQPKGAITPLPGHLTEKKGAVFSFPLLFTSRQRQRERKVLPERPDRPAPPASFLPTAYRVLTVSIRAFCPSTRLTGRDVSPGGPPRMALTRGWSTKSMGWVARLTRSRRTPCFLAQSAPAENSPRDGSTKDPHTPVWQQRSGDHRPEFFYLPSPFLSVI